MEALRRHQARIVLWPVLRRPDGQPTNADLLEKEKQVGALLFGLPNGKGLLGHVGFTSPIHEEQRPALR